MAAIVPPRMLIWAARWPTDTDRSVLTADRLSSAALVVGVVALGLIGDEGAERAGWWLFVISLLVLGMPHGGLDLLLARRLTRSSPVRWREVIGLYLAIMSAAGLTLWVAPTWTLVAFGGLTAVHFGFADQRDALERELGRPVAGLRSPTMLAGGIGRGLFMIGLPLALDAAGVLATLGDAQRMLGVTAPIPATDATVIVGWASVWLGMLLVAAAVALAPTARRRALRAKRHLVEGAVLATAAWALPAIAYVSLYFVLWHSVRHFARVMRLESVSEQAASAVGRGGWIGTVARLHLWSLPLAVPVVLALLLIGGPGLGLQTAREWATLVLLSFVVLTPAHHLLIEWAYARSEAGDV